MKTSLGEFHSDYSYPSLAINKKFVSHIILSDWVPESKALKHGMPGEFHGQRSVVGYSPWGHKESDNVLHVFFDEKRKGIS